MEVQQNKKLNVLDTLVLSFNLQSIALSTQTNGTFRSQ